MCVGHGCHHAARNNKVQAIDLHIKAINAAILDAGIESGRAFVPDTQSGYTSGFWLSVSPDELAYLKELYARKGFTLVEHHDKFLWVFNRKRLLVTWGASSVTLSHTESVIKI